MSNKIWIIGSSNVDMIMQMDHLPEVGETVTDASFMQTFGGKGANTAMAAARAGGDVMFINCVGDDAYAPEMIRTFQDEGMDISLLFRETGISSGTALVMIGKGGSNYLSVAPGANYRLTPKRIDAMEPQLKTAGRILLQCEIPLETNQRVIELADKYGIPVLLNLAPARSMPLESLAKVETLVVNENEARYLLRQLGRAMVPDRELAASLRDLGAKAVVVTLGADGAVLARAQGVVHYPAFSVQAIDTTAAGDTFCGALAVGLAEGNDYAESIRFASSAAALCVGALGAFPSIPRRAEIDAFLAEQ